jgi:hypothetical protein
VLALLLSSPVVGWTAADGWELFGAEQVGASRAQISQQVQLDCQPVAGEADTLNCKPVPGAVQTFGGVPFQRLELTFRDERLEKVAGRLHESHFEALEHFVTQRLGEGQNCSYVFRGGMGAAEFVNRIRLWRSAGYALVIQQFQGKIDRSVFSYGTEAAMSDLVKEKTAYPPGSRRDL